MQGLQKKLSMNVNDTATKPSNHFEAVLQVWMNMDP